MASSNHPIPTHITCLDEEFRNNTLKLNLISPLNNPNSSTSSMTDTNSSSFELREEDYINMSNPRTTETINHLRLIATKMNSAGYLDNCVLIYTSQRSSSMLASLQKLKVQKLSQRNARTLDWGSLESIISDWNRSAIVCVKYLFTQEKQLCHKIFRDFKNDTEDDCFVKIVKEPATLLFEVADVLCSVHPSSEKLLRLLDLYQTLSIISPIVNDLFSSESSEFIRVMPKQLLLKLAELIPRILSGFENEVLKESMTNLPALEIQRSTKYVMDLVCKMCDYKQALMSLITSKPSTNEAGGVSAEFAEYKGQTLLSQHLIWIVMLLFSNLEAKAKLFEEEPKASFFLMINCQYIIRKIEETQELKELIGDGYKMKLNRKLRHIKAEYLASIFNNILGCLRAEGLNGSGIFSSVAKKMIKRLNTFNDRFEKAEQDLSNLVVPDLKLLEDIRESIREKIIPAYESFLEQLKSVLGGGKRSAEQHVKYSVKDLEAAILHLFKNPTYKAK